jgi:hypothetical protein
MRHIVYNGCSLEPHLILKYGLPATFPTERALHAQLSISSDASLLLTLPLLTPFYPAYRTPPF